MKRMNLLDEITYLTRAGGGQKVVALISIVKNFGETQAVITKLGDFSRNVLQIIFLAKKLIRHALFSW